MFRTEYTDKQPPTQKSGNKPNTPSDQPLTITALYRSTILPRSLSPSERSRPPRRRGAPPPPQHPTPRRRRRRRRRRWRGRTRLARRPPAQEPVRRVELPSAPRLVLVERREGRRRGQVGAGALVGVRDGAVVDPLGAVERGGVGRDDVDGPAEVGVEGLGDAVGDLATGEDGTCLGRETQR